MENKFTSITFKKEATKDFISVIIPVYRDAHGLKMTLDSLLHQTLSDKEWEIIVCNDGGDKAVSDLCEKYPVKEISITPNRGSYYARNRGIEEAAGEYLAFVDADITVPENWLENGRKALQRADYVGGPVDIDRTKIKTPADYSEMRSAFPFKLYIEREHFSGAGNLFVRRKVIEHAGGFDERLFSGGDNEFGKRVYETGKCKQLYDENILAVHPPRGYKELVAKKVRTTKGRKHLHELYPDRYVITKPSIVSSLLRAIIPPRIRNIKNNYSAGLPFSFPQYYLFCWRFKIEVTVNILMVYYSKNVKGVN